MKAKSVHEGKLSGSLDGMSDRLRELEQRYKNRKEATDAFNVNRSAFDKWVTSKAMPSVEALAKIAKVAGVSLDWLAFGAGGDTGTPQPLPSQSSGAERKLDRDLMDEIYNSFNALYANRGYEEVKLDMNDLFFYYDELIAMDSREERKITLKAFLTGRNLYIDTKEKEAAEIRAEHESQRDSA